MKIYNSYKMFNKPFLICNNELEIKKFFFLDNINVNKSYIENTSYNAFVFTKDNKCLLCERNNSFYWNFLIKDLNYYNLYSYKNILNIIKNLLIDEFLAFYLFLDKKHIIKIKSNILINKNININLNEINKNILSLEESKINIQYIKKHYINDLILLFNDFYKGIYKLKKHHNLILPGGKENIHDDNYYSIIFREIKEEINIDLKKLNVEILDTNFNFVPFKKDNIIKPVLLYIKIYDKIIKKFFNNISVIIKINIDFHKIQFISNKEIKKIFYIKYNSIKIENNIIENKFHFKTFLYILKKFSCFFDNG